MVKISWGLELDISSVCHQGIGPDQIPPLIWKIDYLSAAKRFGQPTIWSPKILPAMHYEYRITRAAKEVSTFEGFFNFDDIHLEPAAI
jgi:hypothetical protein